MEKKLKLSEDEKEIVSYSTDLVIHNFITLIAISLVAWFLGCLQTALTATFVSALFRALSGGAHSESPINCTIISVIMSAIIGISSIIYGELPALIVITFILLVTIISLKIFWVLAPVDSQAKPITSESHRMKLRQLSIMAVVILSVLNVFFVNSSPAVFSQYALASSFAMSWQAFTLTSPGHKFRNRIDSLARKS